MGARARTRGCGGFLRPNAQARVSACARVHTVHGLCTKAQQPARSRRPPLPGPLHPRLGPTAANHVRPPPTAAQDLGEGLMFFKGAPNAAGLVTEIDSVTSLGEFVTSQPSDVRAWAPPARSACLVVRRPRVGRWRARLDFQKQMFGTGAAVQATLRAAVSAGAACRNAATHDLLRARSQQRIPASPAPSKQSQSTHVRRAPLAQPNSG